MNDTSTHETVSNAEGLRRPAAVNQPQLDQRQILDATAECLREHGYDGTTIRRIAGRLGCAVGSIYRYCDDKRTLLSSVTQRRFEPVAQAIEDHRPLGQSVRLYADIAAEASEQYRLMFWLASAADADDPSPRQIPPIVTRIIEGWSRQIGDPRAAQRMWAQLHGGLALGLPLDALVNDLVQTFDVLSADSRRGEAVRVDDTPVAAGVAQSGNGSPAEAYAGSPRSDREDLTML